MTVEWQEGDVQAGRNERSRDQVLPEYNNISYYYYYVSVRRKTKMAFKNIGRDLSGV